MYVIEVIPMRRGMSRAALTYFSKHPYERGTLLDIPLRKQSAQGIVISSQEVSLAKAALRGASFLLRKLPPQKHAHKLPDPLLRTADELAEYYASQPGAVLFALLPNEIKNGKIPINPESVTVRQGDMYVHRILQAPRDARLLAYKSMVRTSFAENKSIVIVTPTREDGEFLFPILSEGIPGRAYLLHSGIGARRLALAYQKFATNARPVLIVATPQHACIARDDVGTVVLEHARSSAYRARSRPYLDFRHALAVHARHTGRVLVSADLLPQSEDEFLLRKGLAVPFDEHPKRLSLPGKLKTIPIKDRTDGKVFSLFSDVLLDTILKTRRERGRTFLLCARRGLSPVVTCVDCGHILRCPRSGSPLALHRVMRDGVEERWLVSSVSGYRRRADDLCPNCGSWRLRERGIGIQQVYDEMVRQLGDDDIFLFDYQTASTHRKAVAIRDAFYAKKKTVLLGTLLALPYLHDPVETSAIVSMDALRAIPSWRGQEEAFGILLALREKTLGYVFAQIRTADDELLGHARDGSTAAYYTDELAAREQFNYPPYSVFVHLTWRSNPEDTLTREIKERLDPFGLLVYNPPAATETAPAAGGSHIMYGLIRVPSAPTSAGGRSGWPQDALVDALRLLPPSVRIIINPDRIV
ncbi:hypothetical protein HY416_00520 [Candidatus Kaiserbacteria bacterium]|nr:hypothetical protein [Candidatus Kaiserbacteria bacterium]